MNKSDKGKMETIDAQKIKELIRAEGIDLVGVADAQDLMLAHPPRPVTALMQSARSVIVMAVAHSLGAVYSSGRKKVGEYSAAVAPNSEIRR